MAWASGSPKPIPTPSVFRTDRTKAKKVSFAGRQFPVSAILDTFFWFMAERHRIQKLRISGEPRPWTDDEILGTYSFTNIYRVYDRTTQYILRNVINRGSKDLYESCFRVILFRLFNRIETWELLERKLGTPTLKWSEFDMKAYDRILASVTAALYGGAYISPAPAFGWLKNYSNHLRLVRLMMEGGLPDELRNFKHIKDAHGRICLYPSVGEFIGFQLLLDLNMTKHFQWSEREWVALGPGSSACLRKIFGPSVMRHEQAAVRYLYETQMTHFTRLGIAGDQVPQLHEALDPGVSMVDIEHSLCECEKYSRGRFPHIKGKRTQVGRGYVRTETFLSSDLPKHWMYPRPPSPPPTEPPPLHVLDGVPCYEVSHVVAERNRTGHPGGPNEARYLVRWVGYGPEDDYWMSENDLVEGAPELLGKWNGIKAGIARKIDELHHREDA